MTVTRLRRARKPHPACAGYCPRIEPGDYYLEHVEFPNDPDACYANHRGAPVRMAECRTCAERYGRGHYFPDQNGPPGH